MTKIIYSAIQPSGMIHLGNYLGALQVFINIQNNTNSNDISILSICDLHSLTTYNPQIESLKKNVHLSAAIYLAAGVDVKSIYVQSSVKQHTELNWFLSCVTPMGLLNRMTQFKEKAGKKKETAPLGLYAYPVLMAADILLFNATHVPIGEDQKQHLEFTRDIATFFNNKYGQIFKWPEPIIKGSGVRIMSLRDSTKKMSKSDSSKAGIISMLDSNDDIASKIRKAKTDSEVVNYNLEAMKNRSEALNLINIMASISNTEPLSIAQKFAGVGFAEFKKELIEVVISCITPIREKTNYILNDVSELDLLLAKNGERLVHLAENNMKKIRTMLGVL